MLGPREIGALSRSFSGLTESVPLCQQATTPCVAEDVNFMVDAPWAPQQRHNGAASINDVCPQRGEHDSWS